MSTARIIQPRARTANKAKVESHGKAKWILACLLLFLLSASAWAYWFRRDAPLDKVNDLRQQLDAEGLSGEQRRELWGQMREEIDHLTEAQRAALFTQRRMEWDKREMERLTEFFTLSKEKQVAALDKTIDALQKQRKQWEKRRAETEKSGNRGGGGPGGGSGPGGGRGGDPASRMAARLNSTSPEQRAMQGEYRRMMADRMQQRGISPRR